MVLENISWGSRKCDQEDVMVELCPLQIHVEGQTCSASNHGLTWGDKIIMYVLR